MTLMKSENKIQIRTFNKSKNYSYKPSENEEYMSKRQCAYFMRVLKSWKKSIRKKESENFCESNEKMSNVADIASQEEELSISIINKRRDFEVCRKIENSISRLRNGDYGYCNVCGIEIGLDRLGVLSTADLCVECGNISERNSRYL